MSMLMIKERLNQAGKITVWRVTGGVCPEIKNSRMRGKIYDRLRMGFLSKNVLLHKNPFIMAPFLLGDRLLPTA